MILRHSSGLIIVNTGHLGHLNILDLIADLNCFEKESGTPCTVYKHGTQDNWTGYSRICGWWTLLKVKNFPLSLPVCPSVGRYVYHNFLTEGEVSLPCSYLRTCLFKCVIFIVNMNKWTTLTIYINMFHAWKKFKTKDKCYGSIYGSDGPINAQHIRMTWHPPWREDNVSESVSESLSRWLIAIEK